MSGDETVKLTLDVYEKPWDNPDLLESLRRRGLSTYEIANDRFDGRVTPETVRKRLHKFGIIGQGGDGDGSGSTSLADRLDELSSDEVGPPSPEGDQSYRKYTLAGRDEAGCD